MSGIKQTFERTVAGSGWINQPSSIATDTSWQAWLSKFRQSGQFSLLKKREPANQSEFASTPDLLQCKQTSYAEQAYWQSVLPAEFALLQDDQHITAAEFELLAQACHKNGLALVSLGSASASPATTTVIHLSPSQLSCKDWLALHHLAKFLLQPAEIRATQLGITLSAAEVFAKPALIVKSTVPAATGPHPHCILSSWRNPELASLIQQMRDHFLVATASLEKSARHLQEILQAERFSADYQSWYGDILTGKHIAP